MSTELIIIIILVIITLFVSGGLVVSYRLKQKSYPENTSKVSQTRLQTLAEAIRIQTPLVLYDPDLHPGEAEWGLRVADLARKGVKKEDRDVILGSHYEFYTRDEAADNMAAYCKDLPKAK